MLNYLYAIVFLIILPINDIKSNNIEEEPLIQQNVYGINSSNNITTDEESQEINTELLQRYTRALHGETGQEDHNNPGHRFLKQCIGYTLLSSIIVIPIIMVVMYLVKNIAIPDIKDFKIDYCNLNDKFKEACKYIKEAEKLYKNITSHD